MRRIISRIYRKIQKTYYRHLGYYPATIYGHKFKLDPADLIFWEAVSKGNWEPTTYKVLSQFLDANSTYLDIGAWIGPTVIYAAKECKQVICFEPDLVAYHRLLSNIHLNELDNISPYNIAISSESGILKMSSFGKSLGDSMTSLLSGKTTSKSINALVLDWQFIEKLYDLSKVDLIKIDVEGAEFMLIPLMEEYLKERRPTLWLSFHAPFLEEKNRIEALQKVLDTLGRCYRVCLNSELEEVDINNLTVGESINSFPTFLFKN